DRTAKKIRLPRELETKATVAGSPFRLPRNQAPVRQTCRGFSLRGSESSPPSPDLKPSAPATTRPDSRSPGLRQYRARSSAPAPERREVARGNPQLRASRHAAGQT